MVNYANGKIYTIRCRSDENLIYVGSTSQTLSQRMTQHRSDCKRGDGCSLYDYIIDNDWSDFYIELYEKYPCNDKAELCKREGEIIRQIGTINKYIAGRTKKDYRKDNIDKIKEKQKEYSKINAEKIKEYNKKWCEINAEKIKEYSKQHYERNADKINERNKEKVCCDICGAFMRKDGLTEHQKSKKCTDEKSKN